MHPQTVNSLDNLLTLVHYLEKLDEAEKLCRKLLTINEDILGSKHQETIAAAQTLDNILEEKQSQGAFDTETG